MKAILTGFFAVAAALTVAGAPLEDTPLNLLKEGTFQPIYMHGMVTAARGWAMNDSGRLYSIRKKRIYVSGEDCFKLSYADGVFSIVFNRPLNPVYKHGEIMLSSRTASELPPADHYLVRGRVKFKNGKFELRTGYKFPASDDWQDFELTQKDWCRSVILRPEEGAEYHFARLEEFAVYPKIGGSIALPDGGKLEKILIPENAAYEMRHGLSLWRGWLWRITGVALPIVTVKEVAGPVEGALVALTGNEKPGNWSLKVDKNGIVVNAHSDIEVSNALYDYLRRGLGCAFYQRDCQKIPKMGSVKQLTALDFKTDLLYTHFNSCSGLCAMQGGDDGSILYTRNDVDYYHLPSAKSDHVFNVLVPQVRYFKTHPEYFAKIGKNSYNVRENPHYTNHCLTNPELLDLVLKNALEYAKAQYGPRRLVIDEGDSPIHCLCPKCVEYNKGTESCSNSVYNYHEKLAKLVAEARPDLTLERHAYASRLELPDNITKLPDNTMIYYTMGNFRCKLHVECEVNQKSIDMIKRLRKLVGDDPRRVSFMHYSDLRPLYMIKQMKGLNKYGSDSYFIWRYKSFHPAIPFLLGRMNLGEDPEKLLKEFEEAYYGKGAPYIHKAFEIAEEFAANHKHTPGEIRGGVSCSIWPDAFGGSQTILDRKTLDRIHPCYEKALKAAGKDKAARKHIYRDWLFFLTEDLHKFRPASCRTDAEFKQYLKRLRAVINADREFPGAFNEIMHQTDARTFLSGVTGVTVPKTVKHWGKEPILRKMLDDPERYLVRSGETFTGCGLYFKPLFFSSNFENTDETRPVVKVSDYQRDNLLLSPTQMLEMTLPMRQLSKRPVALSVEAVTQSKGGNYSIEVAVNGKSIYNGQVAFAADKWSRMGFSIPPEVLKAGDNKLTVKNTSTGGWIAVSEIYVIDVSADFQAFAAGHDALWRALRDGADTNSGTVKGENGKAVMSVGSGKEVALYFFANNHQFPKIAVTPGGRVNIKITASGKGKLRLGVIRYSPYELDKEGVQKVKPSGYTKHVGNQGERRSKAFKLTAKPRTYEATFDIPENVGLVIPGVILQDGQAEITDLSVTVLQKK